MVTAFLFPGQGSQNVGMGRSWADESAAARSAFAEADEVLGFALSRLCWEGPEEELRLTANTQPAILTASVAVWRAAAERGLAPAAVAGHSLGEYSALVAAGSLAFADALRLVRRRGELMQEAVPVGVGAMAAVIGLSAAEVERLARLAAGDEVCAVANYNAPIQTVVAGHRPAVERAVALATEGGAKRAILLPVSAPFHCELMRPAREALTPLLEDTEFRDPRVPVMTNVDAAPATTGAAARQALARQVDSPVRWVESIERLAADLGVGRFVEIGPGAVLTGLVRRIARDAEAVSLAEPAALQGLLAAEENPS
jgi:[acyl-carrier-protein] S-malonyltransferase